MDSRVPIADARICQGAIRISKSQTPKPSAPLRVLCGKTARNFAAIDFETANHRDESICAVGLAVFADGQLTNSFYSLVRPPKGYGFFRPGWTRYCHGITYRDVYNAPEFPAIAPEIFARLAAADVVIAHNARFDMRVLRAIAAHFGLSCPAFDYLCTLKLSRALWPQLANRQLHTVAAHIGHTFEHHNAPADAEACGRILLAMMAHKNMTTPRELAAALGVPLGRLTAVQAEPA